MKKHENLQDRLARSLDSANRRETKAAPARGPRACEWVDSESCRAGQHDAGVSGDRRHGAKLSISLFAADLTRLEAIRSYMAARGNRISTSQAVKLALRTAPLSEELTAALAEIRKEDGRASKQPLTWARWSLTETCCGENQSEVHRRT